MDYRELFFEIWLPFIFITNSFRIDWNLDFFTFLTYITIVILLQITPDKKKLNSTKNICIQVSDSTFKKHASTQTAPKNISSIAIQTMATTKELQVEKRIQTDAILLHSVGSQTNNLIKINAEKETQTDIVHYKSAKNQTTIETKDKKIQTITKFTFTATTQTENIHPVNNDNTFEDLKKELIVTQKEIQAETSKNYCTTDNLIQVKPSNKTSNFNEEDTYFTLSSLSVLPSSSSQPKHIKKKTAWSRFKKGIKNITHPRKANKHS